MKKKFYIGIACFLAVIGCLCGIFIPEHEINNTIKETQNIVEKEIKTIDENVIVEDITENESASSDAEEISEKEDITLKDEKKLEDEETNIETEGFELQGDISYDGDRAKTWNVTLGDYKGLTYYSQVDSRWKNKMYSSVGDRSQTIGSSGCGPTSASMVVSSIKGEITPDTMANLFVRNGFRSANNGTYWSAYRAVADEFNIGYTETTNIQKAIQLLQSKHYVIVSCGNGLFTTGGHYICIVGIEGNTLKIYDPYLYNGKFNTSTRRGKVEVSGNTVYCSVSNFKAYANAKGFFCYKNENAIKPTYNNSSYSAGQRVVITVPIAVCHDNGGDKLFVENRNQDRGDRKQFWIQRSCIENGNTLHALGLVVWSENNQYLIEVFDNQFWIKEENINIPSVTTTTNSTSSNSRKYVLGNYKATSNLNVRSGAGTNYKIKRTYKKGTVFTVKELKGNWGRTPSGWVCLSYAVKL